MLAVLLVMRPSPALAQAGPNPLARGKYLVEFGGCIDCHTPGYFFGKPDMARALAGSEVGFEIPDLGVFYDQTQRPIRRRTSASGPSSKSWRLCGRERDPMDACSPRSCRGVTSPS
jgi:mono/diheme cytochrome c family protein